MQSPYGGGAAVAVGDSAPPPLKECDPIMNRHPWLHAVGAGLLLAACGAQAQPAGLYLDLKLSGSRQSLADDERVSPRQVSLLAGSDDEDFAQGSIAAGMRVGQRYRAELEYTFPKSTEYTTFWTPFNANANVFQIRSQRLMLNTYREFPLSGAWTANVMLGLGASHLKAKGWQGNPGRFLYEKSQTKLAASLGAGVDVALAPDWSVGLGYRFTHLGRAESGVNDYSTLAFDRTTGIGVQDERMRGRLREHAVFASVRKSF